MSTFQNFSVSVPPDILENMRSAVDEGAYPSTEAILVEALQAWAHTRGPMDLDIPCLRKIWTEAIATEGPGEDYRVVMNRLLEKYSASSSDAA